MTSVEFVIAVCLVFREARIPEDRSRRLSGFPFLGSLFSVWRSCSGTFLTPYPPAVEVLLNVHRNRRLFKEKRVSNNGLSRLRQPSQVTSGRRNTRRKWAMSIIFGRETVTFCFGGVSLHRIRQQRQKRTRVMKVLKRAVPLTLRTGSHDITWFTKNL